LRAEVRAQEEAKEAQKELPVREFQDKTIEAVSKKIMESLCAQDEQGNKIIEEVLNEIFC
jgi:hypothetical protein